VFINAEKLTSAIDTLKAVADMDKGKQPGVMFNIQNDGLDVYYGNAVQSCIIQKISNDGEDGNLVMVDDEDPRGKVIFDYNRLVSIVESCKTYNSNIKAHDVEFKFKKNPDNSGTCIISVSKYTEVYNTGEDGEPVLVGSPELSYTEFDLSWTDANDISNVPLKQQALTKGMYDNMFDTEDAELWDKKELKSVLSSTCNHGEAKSIYFLDSKNGVFAPGTSYHIFDKTTHEMSHTYYMTITFAKTMLSVIDKFKSDSLYIKCIEAPTGAIMAILIFDENSTMSVYLKTTNKSETGMTAINQFSNIEYKSIQLNLMTEVLKDSIKSVQNTNATQDAIISIYRGKTGIGKMTIQSSDTKASVRNEYSINADFMVSTLENEDIEKPLVKMSMNTNILMNIINSNKSNHTALDVFVIDNRVVTRIGYYEEEDFVAAYNNLQNEKNADEISTEDFLNIRDSYVNTYNYFTCTVAK